MRTDLPPPEQNPHGFATALRPRRRAQARRAGGESKHRICAHGKAAWAIEDTPQDLALIYRAMGRKGLESIENVGPKMAGIIEELIDGLV